MTLVKYRPARTRSPFNDMFDELFNFPIGQTLGSDHVGAYTPQVNVSSNEKSFYIEMLVPGYDKKDISVTVEESVLIVSAGLEVKEDKGKDKFTRKEFALKNFTRRFTLPDDIEEEDIKALSKNGVLTISIPRAKPAAKVSKRISIK